jgi:hypothetical protein
MIWRSTLHHCANVANASGSMHYSLRQNALHDGQVVLLSIGAGCLRNTRVPRPGSRVLNAISCRAIAGSRPSRVATAGRSAQITSTWQWSSRVGCWRGNSSTSWGQKGPARRSHALPHCALLCRAWHLTGKLAILDGRLMCTLPWHLPHLWLTIRLTIRLCRATPLGT